MRLPNASRRHGFILTHHLTHLTVLLWSKRDGEQRHSSYKQSIEAKQKELLQAVPTILKSIQHPFASPSFCGLHPGSLSSHPTPKSSGAILRTGQIMPRKSHQPQMSNILRVNYCLFHARTFQSLNISNPLLPLVQ